MSKAAGSLQPRLPQAQGHYPARNSKRHPFLKTLDCLEMGAINIQIKDVQHVHDVNSSLFDVCCARPAHPYRATLVRPPKCPSTIACFPGVFNFGDDRLVLGEGW